MNVILNIKDDAELRKHIKDIIKGQVVSVIRKETLPELKKAIEKELESKNISFLHLIKEIVKEELRRHVKTELESSKWDRDSFVRKEARRYIKNTVAKTLAEEARKTVTF